jgi:hypothetical protein
VTRSAGTQETPTGAPPVLLFACIHNSGRSVLVSSAGSQPGDGANAAVASARRTRPHHRRAHPQPAHPRRRRPRRPGHHHGLWRGLPLRPRHAEPRLARRRPQGQDLATVRRIVDEIDARVAPCSTSWESLSCRERLSADKSASGPSGTTRRARLAFYVAWRTSLANGVVAGARRSRRTRWPRIRSTSARAAARQRGGPAGAAALTTRGPSRSGTPARGSPEQSDTGAPRPPAVAGRVVGAASGSSGRARADSLVVPAPAAACPAALPDRPAPTCWGRAGFGRRARGGELLGAARPPHRPIGRSNPAERSRLAGAAAREAWRCDNPARGRSGATGRLRERGGSSEPHRRESRGARGR